ncbi:hypothetical protein [Amycolatopsis kentuckyensis]|uniref:hypothetical protein n=1 Tax=Amycolatopsis kentuckyensis TaxID=218823 RepID=UPI0035656530
MTEERCERTELFVSQCAHCLGHAESVIDVVDLEGRKHDVEDGDGPTIEAKYPGRCPNCAEQIQPGDPITLVGGGSSAGAWLCAECAA